MSRALRIVARLVEWWVKVGPNKVVVGIGPESVEVDADTAEHMGRGLIAAAAESRRLACEKARCQS